MRSEKSVSGFFKRNAAYIVLALCVLAIGLSITLIMVNRSASLKVADTAKEQSETQETGDAPTTPDEPVDAPDEPVVNIITFVMPVDAATAIEDYTETLAYNSTLKRYEAHKAIDFFAEEGANVYAAYDGVISDVSTSLLTGTTITVNHGDGLYTVYNSLADGDRVFVGQTVRQGAKIGEVSVSNRQESALGAHLHFQVIENGESINPSRYLALDEK
ncbi:MAG: M23 family metallopeptidase [Clostridia bacterium]|nr:M23 family metallopeptidase [Clostridia bacterium]